MKEYLIKLNERMLHHYSNKEEIPGYLFLELAGIIDQMKDENN